MIEFLDEDVPQLLNDLQTRGFIKIMNGSGLVVLRGKLEVKPTDIEWIDEYRKLFSGLKLGSMGDRKSCINKMQEFLTDNPQYNQEIVMLATKLYISGVTNYTYLMKADNFISVSKDNTKVGRRSELAVYCEEVVNNGGKIETIDFSQDA